MNIERTSKGLANTLFDELEKLKRGDSTPQQSRSVAALANTICAVSRLEMDYARFVSSERSDSMTEGLGCLPMGKNQEQLQR